jgi:hypothetical protein
LLELVSFDAPGHARTLWMRGHVTSRRNALVQKVSHAWNPRNAAV